MDPATHIPDRSVTHHPYSVAMQQQRLEEANSASRTTTTNQNGLVEASTSCTPELSSVVEVGNAPKSLLSSSSVANSSHHHPQTQDESQQVERRGGSAVVAVRAPVAVVSNTARDSNKEEGESSVPSFSVTSPTDSTKRKPASISITTDLDPIITSYIPFSHTTSTATTLTKTTSNKSNKSKKSMSPALPNMPASISKTSNMFFSSAHRRRNMATTNALTTYEADLNNKDRAKQKEAIRRFLEENIEEDWKFEWSPEQQNSSTSNGREKRRSRRKHSFVDDLASTGRQAQRWKERDEWLSNTNDSDDDPAMPTAASPDTATPTSEKGGAFKFENPDDVGDVVRKRELDRKIRRERKLQEELRSNEGLRCFVERRDAWTGARRVKRNPTRTSSKTLTDNTNSHNKHETNNDTTTTEESTHEIDRDGYDIDSSSNSEDDATEIPIAPPLLPPTNPMRASITSTAYPTIYDKVIIQNLAPSCPVNLQDILGACVNGWKRDGEWPPKNGAPEASLRVQRKKARKLSVAGILGLVKVDSQNGESGAVNGSSESGLRKNLVKLFGKKDVGQSVAG